MKAIRRSEFKNSDEVARWTCLYNATEGSRDGAKRWAIFQGYAQERAAKRLEVCVNLVGAYKHLAVLDVACGSGHYGLEVAKRGGNWIGMDLSFGMLVAARRLFANHSQFGHLINGDITQPPFPKESFDVIFCVGILSYFKDQEVVTIIKKFPSLLRPGGKLILQTIRLDMITWFRSRLPVWVPRPIRLPGPLYPRKANRIIDMLKDDRLYLSRKIEMKKLRIAPFQTIYLFEKVFINSDTN